MRIKLKIAGLLGAVAVTALAVMAVGASAAFGFSEFNAAAGANPAKTIIKGAGGVAKFESEKGNVITCEKSELTGEFKSHVLFDFKVKYTGKCEIKGAINAACTEPIETRELSAKPGTPLPAGGERGILITEASTSGVLVEPKCGIVTPAIGGSLVCENTKPKPLALEMTIVCEEGLKGEQKLMKIEVQGEAHEDDLLGGTAIFVNEKLAQITTEDLKFNKEIEQT